MLGVEKPTEKPTTSIVTPADFKLTPPTGTGLDDKRVGDLASMVSKWAESHADKGITPAIAALLLDTQIEAAKAEAERNKGWVDALKASRTPEALYADDAAVTSFVRTTFGDEVATLLKDTGYIAHPGIFAGFVKLASAAKEGSIVKPGAPPPVKARLFNNSPEMYGDTARKLE